MNFGEVIACLTNAHAELTVPQRALHLLQLAARLPSLPAAIYDMLMKEAATDRGRRQTPLSALAEVRSKAAFGENQLLSEAVLQVRTRV